MEKRREIVNFEVNFGVFVAIFVYFVYLCFWEGFKMLVTYQSTFELVNRQCLRHWRVSPNKWESGGSEGQQHATTKPIFWWPRRANLGHATCHFMTSSWRHVASVGLRALPLFTWQAFTQLHRSAAQLKSLPWKQGLRLVRNVFFLGICDNTQF